MPQTPVTPATAAFQRRLQEQVEVLRHQVWRDGRARGGAGRGGGEAILVRRVLSLFCQKGYFMGPIWANPNITQLPPPPPSLRPLSEQREVWRLQLFERWNWAVLFLVIHEDQVFPVIWGWGREFRGAAAPPPLFISCPLEVDNGE